MSLESLYQDRIYLVGFGAVQSRRADEICPDDICIWNNGFTTKIVSVSLGSEQIHMQSKSLVTILNHPIPVRMQTVHSSSFEPGRMIGLAPGYITTWLSLQGAL